MMSKYSNNNNNNNNNKKIIKTRERKNTNRNIKNY